MVPYVFISIVVLAIITVLLAIFIVNKKKTKLTPLAGLAFGFIIAGIVFGSNRVIGYSLIGIGVILAIIDAAKKSNLN